MVASSYGSLNLQSPKWQSFGIFLPKLILEVFGAAGAIWGSSEALGLRTTNNIWFWRPAALIVGIVFLARWLKQIRDYVVVVANNESSSGGDETRPLVP